MSGSEEKKEIIFSSGEFHIMYSPIKNRKYYSPLLKRRLYLVDFYPKSTVWKGGEKKSNFIMEKPKTQHEQA